MQQAIANQRTVWPCSPFSEPSRKRRRLNQDVVLPNIIQARPGANDQELGGHHLQSQRMPSQYAPMESPDTGWTTARNEGRF